MPPDALTQIMRILKSYIRNIARLTGGVLNYTVLSGRTFSFDVCGEARVHMYGDEH